MKKIIQPLIILFLVLFTFACSHQKKLNRTFLGHTKQELITQYGKPQKVIPLKNGGETVVYEKQKRIAPASVATGRHHYVDVVSKGHIRVECYRFTLSPAGKVIGVKHEKNILRK